MTTVAVHGTEITIDGTPTYAGRTFGGHKIQGLLFNVRAVQATFDDAHKETRRCWAYPDTGVWDPERNTSEFCAALPSWREHGVLGFTVNLQGGGPLYVPEIYQHYENNAYTREGHLRPRYADRLAQVLACADELGMVAMVGLFYWTQMLKMDGEEAIWRAAGEALSFLEGTGRRNILVELANEVDVVVRRTPYAIFGWDRVHEMIARLRADHPTLLYSTSGGGANVETGSGMPSAAAVAESDYVLLHGNGTRPPQLAAAIQAVRAMPAYKANPKPIVINEDSPAVPNLDAAWRSGASWGYYDQGFEGQADDPYVHYAPRPRSSEGPFDALNGFQTPPVNWTINTPFKRAFFERVAEVTGFGTRAE